MFLCLTSMEAVTALRRLRMVSVTEGSTALRLTYIDLYNVQMFSLFTIHFSLFEDLVWVHPYMMST